MDQGLTHGQTQRQSPLLQELRRRFGEGFDATTASYYEASVRGGSSSSSGGDGGDGGDEGDGVGGGNEGPFGVTRLAPTSSSTGASISVTGGGGSGRLARSLLPFKCLSSRPPSSAASSTTGSSRSSNYSLGGCSDSEDEEEDEEEEIEEDFADLDQVVDEVSAGAVAAIEEDATPRVARSGSSTKSSPRSQSRLTGRRGLQVPDLTEAHFQMYAHIFRLLFDFQAAMRRRLLRRRNGTAGGGTAGGIITPLQRLDLRWLTEVVGGFYEQEASNLLQGGTGRVHRCLLARRDHILKRQQQRRMGQKKPRSGSVDSCGNNHSSSTCNSSSYSYSYGYSSGSSSQSLGISVCSPLSQKDGRSDSVGTASAPAASSPPFAMSYAAYAAMLGPNAEGPDAVPGPGSGLHSGPSSGSKLPAALVPPPLSLPEPGTSEFSLFPLSPPSTKSDKSSHLVSPLAVGLGAEAGSLDGSPEQHPVYHCVTRGRTSRSIVSPSGSPSEELHLLSKSHPSSHSKPRQGSAGGDVSEGDIQKHRKKTPTSTPVPAPSAELITDLLLSNPAFIAHVASCLPHQDERFSSPYVSLLAALYVLYPTAVADADADTDAAAAAAAAAPGASQSQPHSRKRSASELGAECAVTASASASASASAGGGSARSNVLQGLSAVTLRRVHRTSRIAAFALTRELQVNEVAAHCPLLELEGDEAAASVVVEKVAEAMATDTCMSTAADGSTVVNANTEERVVIRKILDNDAQSLEVLSAVVEAERLLAYYCNRYAFAYGKAAAAAIGISAGSLQGAVTDRGGHGESDNFLDNPVTAAIAWQRRVCDVYTHVLQCYGCRLSHKGESVESPMLLRNLNTLLHSIVDLVNKQFYFGAAQLAMHRCTDDVVSSFYNHLCGRLLRTWPKSLSSAGRAPSSPPPSVSVSSSLPSFEGNYLNETAYLGVLGCVLGSIPTDRIHAILTAYSSFKQRAAESNGPTGGAPVLRLPGFVNSSGSNGSSAHDPTVRALSKLVQCFNSPHFKVASGAISLLLKQPHIFHRWVVHPPTADGMLFGERSAGGGDDEDDDDEEERVSMALIDDIVTALRANRTAHWHFYVKSLSNSSLDELVELLYS